MILGIRTVVSQTRELEADTILTPADSTEVLRWKFLSDGTPKTPAHKHSDFKFQDYAPRTFKAIRSIFLNEDEYLLSLTRENALTTMASPGKSGASFYFSNDLRFVIKTITHAEAKFLRSILYRYYHYMYSNPNTLLSKFCGLHRLQPRKGPKVYFVIMTNVFPSWLDVHARYDLKGSTHGRSVGPAVMALPPSERASAVLKDLDFVALGKKIRLGPAKANLFKAQVRRDVEFLASINVMDYSLLLGVHDLNISNSARLRATLLKRVTPTAPALADRDAIRRAGLKRKARRAAKTALYKRPVLVSPLSTSDLPSLTHQPSVASGVPGSVFSSVFTAELGGLQSTDASDAPLSELYFLGIIDFLQKYNVKKTLEHKYKSFRFDRTSISAVPPNLYATRFYSFVTDSVLSDPNPPSEVVLAPEAPASVPVHPDHAAVLAGGRVVSVSERLDESGNIIRTTRVRRRHRRRRSSRASLHARASSSRARDAGPSGLPSSTPPYSYASSECEEVVVSTLYPPGHLRSASVTHDGQLSEGSHSSGLDSFADSASSTLFSSSSGDGHAGPSSLPPPRPLRLKNPSPPPARSGPPHPRRKRRRRGHTAASPPKSKPEESSWSNSWSSSL
ncbi:phosphatidylinositol phosphate kinase PIPK5 [Thecamonas trahens ATCC 50062]|uniref:Phosphatidylinositol phosphate kinase PIPK5 n=1 Tax=Thecamonas trahens ATCC 50062 TaxID=461836 RepID=A0A0L0D531_THETB|nr:phosphatidylinositol phosphate kinase PIPK5 [Thecamonas trahens ATCC 50062]KNC46408.1 phosphatidylinositol phosphate kinase PIPK5 [Thecamonas trahens ATCC 50062]|eukprot:XP_013760701.1 phosphatidylinositol phosphate kinase PIPK5 [Thecamonas trahens ATCC 50062]